LACKGFTVLIDIVFAVLSGDFLQKEKEFSLGWNRNRLVGIFFSASRSDKGVCCGTCKTDG
jgi:hypothetical protein